MERAIISVLAACSLPLLCAEKDVAQPQTCSDQAMALIRKARETADPMWYSQAQLAVDKCLQLWPAHFNGRKAEVMILLGRSDFTGALTLAKQLNREVPDDVLTYGLIADAEMALGDYKEAEEATQWMINLRRNTPAGFERGAILRELFGYPDASLEWWASALRLASPADTEERAWILTQAAGVQIRAGRLDSAEKYVREALVTFPDYPRALFTLGELRMAQRRFSEAAELFRQRLPCLSARYHFADALERAGRAEEARRAWAEFERNAVAASGNPDNANRELVLYFADHARKKGEALRIAKLELSRRHDIFTLDAYAWALHAAGDDREARAQIDRALSPGIKDPALLEHKRAIEAGAN